MVMAQQQWCPSQPTNLYSKEQSTEYLVFIYCPEKLSYQLVVSLLSTIRSPPLLFATKKLE